MDGLHKLQSARTVFVQSSIVLVFRMTGFQSVMWLQSAIFRPHRRLA